MMPAPPEINYAPWGALVQVKRQLFFRPLPVERRPAGLGQSLWRTERAYGYQMDATGPDSIWMSSGFQLVDTVGSQWRLADSDR
jgi:hypothetical protein